MMLLGQILDLTLKTQVVPYNPVQFGCGQNALPIFAIFPHNHQLLAVMRVYHYCFETSSLNN